MKKFTTEIEHLVTIPSGKVHLNGLLYIPKNAKSIVLFVHGSGSSRLSSRNQYVAHRLNAAHHATLLFDLLTTEEDYIDNHTREFRFDINLLSSRLLDVTQWCLNELASYSFVIGYFGASTGAAAALVAAAQEPKLIKAVVSRGGRADMAGDYLSQVDTPTLLIVGGYDEVVIELNQQAMSQMKSLTHLEIVPGATHLFEEPGALDEVASLAIAWFNQYLIEQSK